MNTHAMIPRSAALSLLLLLTVMASLPSRANQLAASASIAITATLHGHISLSTRSVPVSIPLDPDRPDTNYASFPLELEWNLNPSEVQGFEVIGYFFDPAAALVNSSGTAVPATHVLGRWDSTLFQPFNQIHETGMHGASLSLMSEHIEHGRSRGSRSELFELKIDPQIVPGLSGGDYRGVIYIEVRHY